MTTREFSIGERAFRLISNPEPEPEGIALERAREACTCGGAGHHVNCRYWDLLPAHRRPAGIDQVRNLIGIPPCV